MSGGLAHRRRLLRLLAVAAAGGAGVALGLGVSAGTAAAPPLKALRSLEQAIESAISLEEHALEGLAGNATAAGARRALSNVKGSIRRLEDARRDAAGAGLPARLITPLEAVVTLDEKAERLLQEALDGEVTPSALRQAEAPIGSALTRKRAALGRVRAEITKTEKKPPARPAKPKPAVPPAAGKQALRISVIGSGRVTSSPAGIDCGSGRRSCLTRVAKGTTVRLTAQAADGYKLDRWGLDCARAAGRVCSLRMTRDRRVVAVFVRTTAALDVSVLGSGRVTSSRAGIDCGSGRKRCRTQVARGTTVTMTAWPAAGYRLAAWSGGCAGSAGLVCSLRMTRDRSAGAHFVRKSTTTTPAPGSGRLRLKVTHATARTAEGTPVGVFLCITLTTAPPAPGRQVFVSFVDPAGTESSFGTIYLDAAGEHRSVSPDLDKYGVYTFTAKLVAKSGGYESTTTVKYRAAPGNDTCSLS